YGWFVTENGGAAPLRGPFKGRRIFRPKEKTCADAQPPAMRRRTNALVCIGLGPLKHKKTAAKKRPRLRGYETGWSAFVAGLLFGSTNLLFGLDPFGELRAGLIAPLDVELVGSVLDAFFEWKRFDRGLPRQAGLDVGRMDRLRMDLAGSLAGIPWRITKNGAVRRFLMP